MSGYSCSFCKKVYLQELGWGIFESSCCHQSCQHLMETCFCIRRCSKTFFCYEIRV